MLANKLVMIQMAVQPGFVEKRKFPALRELVNQSSGACEFVLKWGAKHLKMEDKAGLNAVVGQHLEVDQNTKDIDDHRRIRNIYAAATSEQKRAMRWMSHKLDSDQLTALDALIEIRIKSKTGAKSASSSKLDSHSAP